MALVQDLKTKKISNLLILVGVATALGFVLFQHQLSGLVKASMGFSTALLLTLPLYLIKALGAGDVKVFLVLGVLHHPALIFQLFLYSLCWSVIFGLIMVVVQKRTKEFFSNLKSLAFQLKPKKPHSIPFAFPLFMGWMSYLVLKQGGLF